MIVRTSPVTSPRSAQILGETVRLPLAQAGSIDWQALHSLDFHLPPELEASEPPEARGLARDQVRLMVSYRSDHRVVHSMFHQLPQFLKPGDLVVINTSGTLKAALPAARSDGTRLVVHLSTALPDGHWVVEVRQPDGDITVPFWYAEAGETLMLPDGGTATLEMPHTRRQGAAHQGMSTLNAPATAATPSWLQAGRQPGPHGGQVAPLASSKGAIRAASGSLSAPSPQAYRLWRATLRLPEPLHPYLDRYGSPIRYKYVQRGWPSSYYQTVYADEPGSAEMPSAGRAFTRRLISRLEEQGIQFASLVLHTGVASLEDHEPPYEEYYRVPVETARRVNATRSSGGRVIAVGTTTVRALETVSSAGGVVRAGSGWTDLVITPQRGIRAVHGMLTGLHEPKATHLAMLEALAGLEHLGWTYAEALRERYLWHEFGDLHLILP